MRNNLFYVEEEKKEEEKVDTSINVGIWPYGLSGAYNWTGGGGGYTWATYGAGAYNGMMSWGNWAIENKYSFENRCCF